MEKALLAAGAGAVQVAATYAASGIAGSPPLRTARTAMVLASEGFIVPFMFVYGPPLLLVGSVGEIVLVVGAVALIFPDPAWDGFGLLVLLFIFFRRTPQNWRLENTFEDQE